MEYHSQACGCVPEHQQLSVEARTSAQAPFLPCSYSGVKFNQNDMRVKLGDIVLMDKGQPLEFDKSAASGYLKTVTSKHGTVYIDVQVGSGGGHGTAWGCDLSYE